MSEQLVQEEFEGLEFDGLPSRTPTSPRRAARRVDPFYDPLMWRSGSTLDWASRRDAQRMVEAAAMMRLRPSLQIPEADAWARIETTREKALRIVGALQQWRSMTAEQAEALTGIHNIDEGRTSWMRTLWAADLLDFAAAGTLLGTYQSTARLMRVSLASPAFARLLEGTTLAEFIAATGGRPLGQNRQYDRHNILTVELMLRVAEFTKMAAVVGELFSTYDLLLFGGTGRSLKSSDATLIREDGLRVAMELTAAHVEGRKKVAGVAATLREARRPEVLVLFVNATGNTATGRAFERAIEAEGYGVRDQIAIVDWTRWFPDEGHVAADFAKLPAQFFNGTTWSERSIMGLPTLTDSALLEAIRAAAGLHGTPHWMQQVERPSPSALAVRNADFPDHRGRRGVAERGRRDTRASAS